MPRGKRKKIATQKADKPALRDDGYCLRTRRSSMRVNLSYVSNLSDSGNSSLKRSSVGSDKEESIKPSEQSDDPSSTVKKSKIKHPYIDDNTATPASIANITVINVDTKKESKKPQCNSIISIKEKEQQLNKSCMQLKDAIMNKTQALFDEENELAIKTSEVLTGYTPPVKKASKVNEMNDQTSPSVKVNIGKNDQIVMSGDGRKENPVQVNLMCSHDSSEMRPDTLLVTDNENDKDRCSQSIASTPKKSIIENYEKETIPKKLPQRTPRIPVARLFADDDPNDSMSDINVPRHLQIVNNQKRSDDINKNKNVNNVSIISNNLDNTTSPILSQGTRKSRISRLSLKKKLTKVLTQSTENESFVYQVPLTCSSFIEKQGTITVESDANKTSKTIELDDKSDTVNLKTIILDNNENSSKTIEIQSSAGGSGMELTTISSNMPIIRRSFQHVIRRSLKLDCMIQRGSQSLTNEIERQLSSNSDKSKNINNKVDNVEQLEKVSSINVDHYSNISDTVPLSLNENSLLDPINLPQDNAQEGSEKLENVAIVPQKVYNNELLEKNDTTLIEHQTSTSIRSSMQVNTSLDSVRRSSVPKILTNEKLNEGLKMISLQKNSSNSIETDDNKKILTGPSTSTILHLESLSNEPVKESSGGISSQISSRPSTSTTRSSLEVNTSLDSVHKSQSTKNALDFNKMLSIVQETSSNNNQSKTSECTSNDQSSNTDEDLENISLIKRIKNISTNKNVRKLTEDIKKSDQEKINRTRQSTEIKNANPNTKKMSKSKDAANIQEKLHDSQNISRRSKRKLSREEYISFNKTKLSENISSTTNESSVVETTPYPTSRSVLFKTMIKNSIAMNTLDPRKFVDFSDNEDLDREPQQTIQDDASPPKRQKSIDARKNSLTPKSLDTVVLDSTDESTHQTNKRREAIIDESSNEVKACDTSTTKETSEKRKKKEKNDKKILPKRKLYPLRENSQLISFSPADIQVTTEDTDTKEFKTRKKRKLAQQKKQNNNDMGKDLLSLELATENDPLEDNRNVKKPKKKPKKIVRKKIVVKKVTNLTLLDNMMNDDEEQSQRLSERNSLREFDLRRAKSIQKEKVRKNHKIVIVVTGLPIGERDLVKSVIKALGSAILEPNVTPRTTHVVSSGIRTINLLKAIIRGCWLLSMEWVLMSLEKAKWLDPKPYEMAHFSTAVQVNRRDRQLFGKGYVPELFVTCGFIYVENGTSPPPQVLKELIKIAGGRITEDADRAEIMIGSEGLKEIWVLDSITTGEVQPTEHYEQT